MYLYVEFFDSDAAYTAAQLGASTSCHKRIKKIKLTEEQVKQLQPRHTSGDFYENVSSSSGERAKRKTDTCGFKK
jgi:cobalamin biosynthesis protein CbiD